MIYLKINYVKIKGLLYTLPHISLKDQMIIIFMINNTYDKYTPSAIPFSLTEKEKYFEKHQGKNIVLEDSFHKGYSRGGHINTAHETGFFFMSSDEKSFEYIPYENIKSLIFGPWSEILNVK